MYMSKLVKPIEYAKAQGISRQAVYAKIKKGVLVSKNVEGKIYIVLEEELSLNENNGSAEQQEQNSSHLIDVKELLTSKEQTITVLRESITDLKQTNTEINTTLRGEIELLKQVFTEMRNLYVKQVDYMNTEKKIELENKLSSHSSSKTTMLRDDSTYEDVLSLDELPNDEEECWMSFSEFLERSGIVKEKKKNKIANRLRKAHQLKDKRIKIENQEIFLSCYHFYEDILKR